MSGRAFVEAIRDFCRPRRDAHDLWFTECRAALVSTVYGGIGETSSAR